MDMNKIVTDGYDQIADYYHAKRLAKRDVNGAYFDTLIHHFPQAGKLLDLGCGGGQPVTAYFSEKGFDVVGVDVSANMIEIARREIPGGQFFESDMVDCTFNPQEFDVIISLFAIIHVPQDRQRLLFKKMHAWLKPAGVSYLTLGYREEKELIKDDWHGVKMIWSTFSQQQYLELLIDVGFALIRDEVEQLPNGETFYNVLLRKA